VKTNVKAVWDEVSDAAYADYKERREERRKAGIKRPLPSIGSLRFLIELETNVTARLFAHVTRRIDALEQNQKATGWMGVWSPVARYERGQFVSCSGSLYHCNRTGTESKPGNSDDWSLMVKSAR
jgi:hypothetical protein